MSMKTQTGIIHEHIFARFHRPSLEDLYEEEMRQAVAKEKAERRENKRLSESTGRQDKQTIKEGDEES